MTSTCSESEPSYITINLLSLQADVKAFPKNSWLRDVCPEDEDQRQEEILSCYSIDGESVIDCSDSGIIDYTSLVTDRLKFCFPMEYHSYVGNFDFETMKYKRDVFEADGYWIKLKDKIPVEDFSTIQTYVIIFH